MMVSYRKNLSGTEKINERTARRRRANIRKVSIIYIFFI